MSTITILNHTFEVRDEDPSIWADSAMGRACLIEQVITINNRLAPGSKLTTFLHEIVHMICDIQSVELSETQISALSVGIQSLLVESENSYLKELIMDCKEHLK